MDSGDILTQRDWTEQELHEAGFRYYKRKPRVVLARKLPDEEAPLEIKYNDDTLIAKKGLCDLLQGWLAQAKIAL